MNTPPAGCDTDGSRRDRRDRRRRRRSGAADGASPPPPPDPGVLIPDADHEALARRVLLDQLTGRARSRAELARKLAGRGVPPEISERLLDRFEQVGLVDDEAFASEWVASRQATRGLGRRALAWELDRHGVEPAVAQEALARVAAEDEAEVARQQVRRRLRSMQELDRDRAARRLVAMLARKGHAPSLAYRVVREELELVDAEWDAEAADPE